MKRICICFLLGFAGCQQQVSDNRDEPDTGLVFASSQDGAITNLFGMKFVPVTIEKSVEGHSRTFMMQTHEVTVAQFQSVIEPLGNSGIKAIDEVDGSKLIQGFDSWNAAENFTRTISRLDAKHSYRLPTEAEWKAGCAGQIVAPPSPGSDTGPVNAVGTLRHENAFGLHNMLSGLAEYTSSDFVEGDAPAGMGIAEGNDAKVVMGDQVWSESLGQFQRGCDQRKPISMTGDSLTIGVRLIAENR
ncbi:formylglycine-generating enzyme family protein [Rosistilla oblonga]|uniref:Formylglycine-generating sulfatase enzyme n=1 Tax=Rosistilla oblonga TaxID=2527990 RepID=A0A518J037_9BACT|nr:SUMF1/EgtB/PvdO family nonheme iron enzyme [Rosistilla oblonga]QDV58707.1 Formylglycine-generating sulfatase enzyme [Rosistilla oblonga]